MRSIPFSSSFPKRKTKIQNTQPGTNGAHSFLYFNKKKLFFTPTPTHTYIHTYTHTHIYIRIHTYIYIPRRSRGGGGALRHEIPSRREVLEVYHIIISYSIVYGSTYSKQINKQDKTKGSKGVNTDMFVFLAFFVVFLIED